MSKILETDMEVVDFLLNDKRFSNDVKVTYVEITTGVEDGIDKKLINDIESITNQSYYFYDKNQRIAIERLIKNV